MPLDHNRGPGAFLAIINKEENVMENNVPIWEKYALTINEAAEYFHIGENKLRSIVDSDLDAEYLLYNGNRIMIKRRLFEQYIDGTKVI